MHREVDAKKRLQAALLSLALTASLAACTLPIIEGAPSFHTQIVGVASASQLIAQLQSSGFSEVRVTPLLPNGENRRPELMYAFTSPDDEDAQVTPLHFGWNGTAVKDGRVVDIYVDRAPRRQSPANTRQ